MDNKLEILLGSEKNITSVNRDNYNRIELTNSASELNEFTVNDLVNASDVFNAERTANPIYRIYGRIEYLSLLNGLINNYKILEDFFNPVYNDTSKNIINSFKFYLVKPAISGYTEISNTTKYVRYFEVIATPNQFELYPAGFSSNVYGEQGYIFSFNKDFDVSKYYDEFGFPVTELFLYAQYELKTNGNGVVETMKFSKWNSAGTLTKTMFSPITLSVGDYVKTGTGEKIGDLINYDQKEFTQTQLSGQTVFIKTQYNAGNLIWKFNPLIPFRLRYLGNELNSANTGSTSYDIINSIPDYATKIDSAGNYVWRDIVPQGFTEPLTGNGVDYPFINGKRYLFSSNILSVSPDLNDYDNSYNTKTVFTEIALKSATILNITPLTDLDKIGEPCQ